MRFARRLHMRRIVRPEATALVAKIIVWRVWRRYRRRHLRQRLRLGWVFNIKHPQRLQRLIAIRVEHLGIGNHEAAIQARDINGMERQTALLHLRIKTADQFRVADVGEVVHQHAKSTPGAVAKLATILNLGRHIHRTVQRRPRFTVTVFAPFFIVFLFTLALPGHPPVGDEFGARRVRHIDDLHTVTVIADRTFHADEAVVRRGIEVGILSAIIKTAVRA